MQFLVHSLCHKNPNHFSSCCISQIWSTAFLQSFWQHFWLRYIPNFLPGPQRVQKTKSKGSNIYNIQNPITLAWIDAIFLVFFKILINWKSPHKSLLFHPLLCFVVVVGRVREHRFICCVFQLDPPETGTSSHLNLNLVASANSL